ncbi:ATPase-AAA-core domain-containing protein [Favolaschia claudopus]|uniref:ATPase-AAA-core domain-containing protein n=1 Tax=Favolaschia claudopus TaxID=2862362 RepID=A0AAV9ZB69_9AGAR
MSRHISHITLHLSQAAELLTALQSALSPPFIHTLSTTTTALANALQNVKRNQDECNKLVEHIPTLLTAIVNLHMKSNPVGTLSAAMLHHLGEFTKTLTKIYTYIEAQLGGRSIKHFFRQDDTSTLLKSCYAEVEQAKVTFKMNVSASVLGDMVQMQSTLDSMHDELLASIAFVTELGSEINSSIYHSSTISKIRYVSGSLSVLPARPTICHGREIEVASILKLLQLPSPRIAILGAGGMGKTTLARVALHESEVTTHYETRIFVSCDATNNGIDIANNIGLQLGLKTGKDIRKLVVQFLKEGPACLLILDNLETPWEPPESRNSVEEFLALLSDIKHLALMITMRGAERPNQVPWSRPFLLPLSPLSDEAAQQTFTDITDYTFDTKKMVQLLQYTDNMPLAVNLLAHLVDYEGITSVLNRWETERTSLLSVNTDRTSSLDVSISISLSSSRVVSSPNTQKLLSILSILPEGLSDTQLLQSNLPIPNLMECKTTLLRTALAYYDEARRLKSLVPIREYIHKNHPPSLVLVAPLQNYIHSQIHLFEHYQGTDQMSEIHKALTANSGNIQSVLSYGLNSNNLEIHDTIECAISFSSFERSIGHGQPRLMDTVSSMLVDMNNPKLHVLFIMEEFRLSSYHTVSNPQQLYDDAMQYLEECNDQALAARFYESAGYFYQNDTTLSRDLFEKALTAAQICGNITLQSRALVSIAQTDWKLGNYILGQNHASEAYRLSRLVGNLYYQGRALCLDAMCTRDIGNYDIAVELFHSSRNCLARCALAGGRAYAEVMACLAELHLSKSEYSEAYQIYTTIMQDAVLAMNKDIYVFSLLNIAQIDIIIGTPAHEVLVKIDELVGISTALQRKTAEQLTKIVSTDLSLREGNHTHAQSVFTAFFHKYFGNHADYALNATQRLADLEQWNNQYFDKTFIWAMVYLCYAFKLKNKLNLHKALAYIGQICLAQHDLGTAHDLFTVALEGFVRMGVHHDRARCLLYLGNIAEQEGNAGKATELWTMARPLFEKTLQFKDVEKIDAKLANMVEEQVTATEQCMHYVNPVPFEKSQSRLAVSLM